MIMRMLTSRRNRRIVYLSLFSFTTSVVGFMFVQVFGATITSFSIWTLNQSQMIPPQFPFFYIPEILLYGIGMLSGSVLLVFLLIKLRMIR